MFMQAGFAFLEAGLTRMGTPASPGERLIFRGLLARLLHVRVRAGLRRRQVVGATASSLRPDDRGRQKPFDLGSRDQGRPALFEVVFAGVSLASWDSMAERAKLTTCFGASSR
jgi:hypothetical protein